MPAIPNPNVNNKPVATSSSSAKSNSPIIPPVKPVLPDTSPDTSHLTGFGPRKLIYIFIGVLVVFALVLFFLLGGEDSTPIQEEGEGDCSAIGFQLLNCSYVLDGLTYKTTIKFKRIEGALNEVKSINAFLNFESNSPKFERITSIPGVGYEGEEILTSNYEPVSFYLLISFYGQKNRCKSTAFSCFERVQEDQATPVTGTGNNTVPVADAGSNQDVEEGVLVVLNGSDSYDADGDTLTYSWVQISGVNVTLSDNDTVAVSFTTPSVDEEERLVFELTVSDGIDTATDRVNIDIEIEEVADEGSIGSIPSLPPSMI